MAPRLLSPEKDAAVPPPLPAPLPRERQRQDSAHQGLRGIETCVPSFTEGHGASVGSFDRLAAFGPFAASPVKCRGSRWSGGGSGWESNPVSSVTQYDVRPHCQRFRRFVPGRVASVSIASTRVVPQLSHSRTRPPCSRRKHDQVLGPFATSCGPGERDGGHEGDGAQDQVSHRPLQHRVRG